MQTRTGASLLLICTFLLGGVGGAISYHLYHNRVGADAPQTRTSRPTSHDIVEEMATELKLDQDQKASLKQIIGQSRERYHKLSSDFQPQYDKIRMETRQAIRNILRQDQQALFDNSLKQMDDRRRQHGRNPR